MDKWEYIKTNYIDKGLKIFPVVRDGKTPMIENWQNECSCDYFQVLYWYTNCKGCNWGLPANENNLFILDLDVHDEKKNGIENFNIILDTIYQPDFAMDYKELCETLIQKTPSGGIHIIYKSDDDLKNVSNTSNMFEKYPGIDCRTSGYIVTEPSEINGNKYSFCNKKTISNMDDELKKFILENANVKNDKDKKPYEKPKYVECGDRDNQLFSYINNIYYKTRLDFDEVLCLALHFNENNLEEPFDDRDVKYKVKKCFEKDRNEYIYIRINSEE